MKYTNYDKYQNRVFDMINTDDRIILDTLKNDVNILKIENCGGCNSNLGTYSYNVEMANYSFTIYTKNGFFI